MRYLEGYQITHLASQVDLWFSVIVEAFNLTYY